MDPDMRTERYCVEVKTEDELLGTLTDWSRELDSLEDAYAWVEGHVMPGCRWAILKVGFPECVSENGRIVDVRWPVERLDEGVA